MTPLRRLWPLAAALGVGLPVPLFRLHFFHTESAPIGLWRALPGARPRVGEVVRFCMRSDQARAVAGRPYAGGGRGGPCPHGTWMLAKPVIAGPGDTVVHTPAVVLVNGRPEPLSVTRSQDTRGLAVPAGAYGTIVLREGEFWVHSPYADGSFDSRYLGVVRVKQMRGTVRPVLTWLTRGQRAALRARGLRPARCGLVACVQRENGISIRFVCSPACALPHVPARWSLVREAERPCPKLRTKSGTANGSTAQWPDPRATQCAVEWSNDRVDPSLELRDPKRQRGKCVGLR